MATDVLGRGFLLAILLLPAACSSKGGQGSGLARQTYTATDVVDSSRVKPTAMNSKECDVSEGIRVIRDFFDALNRRDLPGISSLLTKQGAWDISFAPEIGRARLIAGRPVSDEPMLIIRAPEDLPVLLAAVSGLQFRLIDPVAGGIYEDTNPGSKGSYRIGISPLLWEAEGQALREQGWTRVEGGGKAALSCGEERIIRILLSPLSYS